jgi:hypothetical protein
MSMIKGFPIEYMAQVIRQTLFKEKAKNKNLSVEITKSRSLPLLSNLRPRKKSIDMSALKEK